jgi:ComF family protein
MVSLRSLRLGGNLSRPIAARGRELIAGWLTGLGQAVDALVFPWSCSLCGAEGSTGPFCPSCRRELLERSVSSAKSACPRCAMHVGPFADLQKGCSECRGRSLGFDAALAFGPYDEAIKDLCLQLKHEQNAWLAPWLGGLLVEGRREAISQLPADAWVVPIPLHWWRHWRRGYNQAEVLARDLAKRLGLPIHRPLRRIKATPRLASMGITERGQVLHRAFRARSSPQLKGRTVLLVDDILTTGATCGEAARELKRAGAARVVAVVIARAERRTS